MTAQPPLPPTPLQERDDNEINLLELLSVLLDNRWLIAAVTAVAVLLGAAYALFATPIYRADTLIQVEDSKGEGMAGLLGDAAGMFDIHSPATAEMQLLRSRLVVGQAIKDVHLDLKATPKYTPIVGRWLANHATKPSTPGIFGMGGYVSGNESLQVSAFDLPRDLEGKTFRVRLTKMGYELLSPNNDVLGQGTFGQSLEFSLEEGQKGHLSVTGATGLPGAEFNVIRFSTLDKIEEIQKKLSINEQGKQSGVLSVSLESDDPRQLTQLLQAIGTRFVEQNVQRKAAEAEKTLGFLGNFLPQLRQQLEDAESKFNQFRNKNTTFNLGDEGKSILEHSVKLQTSLLELEQKRKELRALYTPEHYSVRAVDAQIGSVKAELGEIDHKVKVLPNIEQDLLRLTRDVKVNSELYVNLLNSAQQLRLVKEGKVGNVRIVDPATEPRRPEKPQRALVVALAAMLGLMLGAALAFLRNSLRPGLTQPEDIEQHTGLHVLATVPHSVAQVKQAQDVSNRVPGKHVLVLTDPSDTAVESLRSLRTALQFAMLDARNNILMISGPTPGLGKSFTSINLAAVLGANNKKTLLIDADMRKGHLNQYFGLGREKGLSEILSGSIKLEDALHRNVVPNVDLITTGVLPPNAAELLAMPTTRILLNQLMPQYDLIVIDTPPVLVASDTAVLAPIASALLFVARAKVTTVGELQESTKRLRQLGVQVSGVIFNDLDISKRRYALGLGAKYGNYRYVDYKY